MLEHSIYSVISPEGCASILYRNPEKAEEAAAAMKITAQDLQELQIIDAIVPEPVGGAHREPQTSIAETGKAIERALRDLGNLDGEALRERRRDRFLRIGRDGLG
jgi:acetyl-CoA carboxylase carboxyl transferase subunit alpha